MFDDKKIGENAAASDNGDLGQPGSASSILFGDGDARERAAGGRGGRSTPVSDGPQIKDFDWTLLAIVAAIIFWGWLEIYSSTHASAMSGTHWKQMVWLGVGVVVMFIMSQIDYHTLLDQAPILYIAGVAGTAGGGGIGFSRLGRSAAFRWAAAVGSICKCQSLYESIIIIVLGRYFSEVRTDKLTLTDILQGRRPDADSICVDLEGAGPGNSPGAGAGR